MTDEALLILCAKDYVLKTHKWNILNWSKATWDAAVTGILKTLTDDTLIEARKVYK